MITASITGLVFALVGLALVAYAATSAAKGAASERWPRGAGVITRASVDRARGVDGDILERVELAYEFNDGSNKHIGSRSYYGDRLLLAFPFLRRRRQRDYAVGQNILVSYDPNAPGESVLRPGIQPELLAVLFVGIASTVLGAATLFVSL